LQDVHSTALDWLPWGLSEGERKDKRLCNFGKRRAAIGFRLSERQRPCTKCRGRQTKSGLEALEVYQNKGEPDESVDCQDAFYQIIMEQKQTNEKDEEATEAG
jgi:hypothetical protein